VGSLVLIKWIDSRGSASTWTERDGERVLPIPCVSGGILLEETEEEISLILSRSSDYYLHAITIPKGCIKKMWKLKVR
jgi:hypothetical protein